MLAIILLTNWKVTHASPMAATNASATNASNASATNASAPAWTTWGNGTVCHSGDNKTSGKDIERNWAPTLDACKETCATVPVCYGVQYQGNRTDNQNTNCEIWKQPIVSAKFADSGFQCLNYTSWNVTKSSKFARLSIHFDVSNLPPTWAWPARAFSIVRSAVQDTLVNYSKVTNKHHNGSFQLNASQVMVVFTDEVPWVIVTANIDLSDGLVELQWKLNATGIGNGTRKEIASSLQKNLTVSLSSSRLNAGLPIVVYAGFAEILKIPSAGNGTNGTNVTNGSVSGVAIASSAHGGQATMIKGVMALLAALWV